VNDHSSIESIEPTETCVLVLPGFGGSGPEHWQSIWEQQGAGYRRVEQRDWDKPDLVEWIDTLERYIDACSSPPVLVAHSLACALVAHFAAQKSSPIGAALLVSPADVDEISEFYTELESFAPMPLTPLPFPTTVVASNDDLYVLAKRAELFAQSWGSDVVMLDGAGHMNADSGVGGWKRGKMLLSALFQRL
jgi:predicted alpha/beta hydrolase family esterase